MSASATAAAPAVPIREDASVMALVGGAHCISHFCQLLLPPLFPWLKDAFQVGYAELGFLMTVFFTVSCAVQTASGFLVDRLGPRPVLLGGLACLAVAAFGYAASTSYWMLAGFSVVAGIGNGVFHPVDYTLLNRLVSTPRLGHAYSVHGVTGSLGWALAPAFLVSIALGASWRVALVAAGVLVVLVWSVVWWQRNRLNLPAPRPAGGSAASVAAGGGAGGLGFLRIPAVWMCFTFFLFSAMALGAVQAFAPEAARQIHGMPLAWVATCLTTYMLASASGMAVGGFLAADPQRAERVVATSIAAAAVVSLLLALTNLPALAVPLAFGLMGLSVGLSGPSRDMLVKRSTPDHASGRVYGVVYSGLDIGQAIAPLIFGVLMDQQAYRSVLVGLAMVQVALILTAVNVRRVRRTVAAS